MNPYTRFRTVSTLMAATVTIGAVLAFGMPAFEAISNYSGGTTGPGLMAATGASLALLVVGWLSMTEVIFPLIFRLSSVRKAVLGKYYIEGTWLQAERGVNERRMSVIDIQPDGDRFIFSGYALNEELEIESNIMIEFSRFEWPFMVYKYRNSLSDGSDGRRDGVGEIQLEMNRSSARRYNGFLQYVKNDERLKIEGAKLMSGVEVNKLRSLSGRRQVFEKYWKLFFHRAMRPLGNPLAQAPVAAADAPAHVRALRQEQQSVTHADKVLQTLDRLDHSPNTNAPVQVERRKTNGARPAGLANGVVPRRRASDWSRPEPRPVIRIPENGSRTGTED